MVSRDYAVTPAQFVRTLRAVADCLSEQIQRLEEEAATQGAERAEAKRRDQDKLMQFIQESSEVCCATAAEALGALNKLPCISESAYPSNQKKERWWNRVLTLVLARK